MHKSVSEIIDIVILVLFLAVGFSTGVRGLYNILRETEQYTLEMEDKNAAVKASDVMSTGEYDTLMSPGEICLMAQIQDAGMPAPHCMSLGGEEIEINTDMTDNLVLYVSKLNTVLNNQYKYLLRYDYNTRTYLCTPYTRAWDPITNTVKYQKMQQ